jgi:hypothetical protein
MDIISKDVEQGFFYPVSDRAGDVTGYWLQPMPARGA